MFDGLEDLDAAGALACAVDRRRAADRAEAELLAIAAHWADLHAVVEHPEGISVSGMERLMPLAGPGAPEVAEFAPAELGAALGVSTAAGQDLLGDALELRHRLPRVWARIQDGSLQAWRGQQVAARTRCLSPEAAAWVDAQVAPFAHKIGVKRVLDLVEAALIQFDPAAAAKRAQQKAETRGVWVGEEMTDGTCAIRIEADALDVVSFDQAIAQIATALGRLGDQDLQDVRRAKAVGVIADPQGALDLLTDSDDILESSHISGSSGSEGSGAGEAPSGKPTSKSGKTRSRVSRHSGGRAKVTMYVHLHGDAIRGHGGVARVEGLGPVTIEQVQEWLGRGVAAPEVTIKQVLDLADRASVDAYEVPDRMSETVYLRNPCCPFPWCNNLSRKKDSDHVEAFVPPERGGSAGQTAPDKLAPLCRRHHRLKTHGGWTYTMPEPGLYLWRSPRGRRYLVDHTGATALADTA